MSTAATLNNEEAAASARSAYVTSARNAALWVAGGGLVTAATYFGGAGGSYWIAWGPVLFGGFVALRALVAYFRAGGGPSALLTFTLLLLVVGGGCAASVAEAEREWGVASSALTKANALVGEAAGAVDTVIARQTPWGAADIQDMYRVADLYEQGAHELIAMPTPLLRTVGQKQYWWVDALSTLYAQRADLARRIALAITDVRRETLLREWDEQTASARELAEKIRQARR